MAKEIEILIALKSDFETAKIALAKFDFKGAKKTVDHYYFDPLRSDLHLDADKKLNDVCRIREKAGSFFVAYKTNHYEEGVWLYSDEFETEFSDLKALQEIFQRLGLQLLVTVNNTKHIFETEQYEIALEDVEGLGYFLEVEVLKVDETKSVQEIKTEIRDFIYSLGLQICEELNQGKPELMLLKRKLI